MGAPRGTRARVGTITILSAGIRYADGEYLWFGNLGGITALGTRQERRGFVTMEDYPYIQLQVKDGKNRSSAPVAFNYKSIVFNDDGARGRFYNELVRAFKEWHRKFPGAYDGELNAQMGPGINVQR